jgi:hypothetical protein
MLHGPTAARRRRSRASVESRSAPAIDRCVQIRYMTAMTNVQTIAATMMMPLPEPEAEPFGM